MGIHLFNIYYIKYNVSAIIKPRVQSRNNYNMTYILIWYYIN